jgi:hypothetical protein
LAGDVAMATPAQKPCLVVWVLVGMTLSPSLTGSRPASAQAPSELAGLISQLHDESPAVRRAAASALIHIGAEVKDVVPVLTKLLEDPDGGKRQAAASALREIGAAKDAVEAEQQPKLQ